MFILLDLETTGLDANSCDILEVGVLVISKDFTEISSFQSVAHFKHTTESINKFVLDMHAKTNLWSECEKSDTYLGELEDNLLVFLNSLSPAGKMPLVGSTISFDRSFLKVHLPRVEAWFHYRNIDVSSFKLMTEAFGKQSAPKGKELHRSISDCRDSANALKYYVELFGLNGSR